MEIELVPVRLGDAVVGEQLPLQAGAEFVQPIPQDGQILVTVGHAAATAPLPCLRKRSVLPARHKRNTPAPAWPSVLR